MKVAIVRKKVYKDPAVPSHFSESFNTSSSIRLTKFKEQTINAINYLSIIKMNFNPVLSLATILTTLIPVHGMPTNTTTATYRPIVHISGYWDEQCKKTLCRISVYVYEDNVLKCTSQTGWSMDQDGHIQLWCDQHDTPHIFAFEKRKDGGKTKAWYRHSQDEAFQINDLHAS